MCHKKQRKADDAKNRLQQLTASILGPPGTTVLDGVLPRAASNSHNTSSLKEYLECILAVLTQQQELHMMIEVSGNPWT